MREVLMHRDSTSPVMCNHDTVHFRMEKQISAASFKVLGFNSKSGYTGERVFKQDHGNGIKTEVRGNPEGFAEGIV
jgi:hypothetical protein